MEAASTSITPTWVPNQARDFANEPACHTVCACLAALLNPSSDQEQDGIDAVFQINHCYVAIPGAGEQVLTKDGERVWIANLDVLDTTGRLTVAVREKAALALSGCDSKTAFTDAHTSSNISFPVLASVRIHVTLRKDQPGGAPKPTAMRATMVEAEDQDMCCMPNQSLLFMAPMLKSLSASTEELKIARLCEISVLPHTGMVVDNQQYDLTLVLAAATEKSKFQKFGEGYRLTTNNVLDIGFGNMVLESSECSGKTK